MTVKLSIKMLQMYPWGEGLQLVGSYALHGLTPSSLRADISSQCFLSDEQDPSFEDRQPEGKYGAARSCRTRCQEISEQCAVRRHS